MMVKAEKGFLLTKYFNYGWLDRCYYDGKQYCQPYSAEDRLRAGELFYEDFLVWRRGEKLIADYQGVKVDSSRSILMAGTFGVSGERFRRALQVVSKAFLVVVYQVVLAEEEIKAPKGFSARERLHFNDEIKGLLCRGLDELCGFYAKR